MTVGAALVAKKYSARKLIGAFAGSEQGWCRNQCKEKYQNTRSHVRHFRMRDGPRSPTFGRPAIAELAAENYGDRVQKDTGPEPTDYRSERFIIMKSSSACGQT